MRGAQAQFVCRPFVCPVSSRDDPVLQGQLSPNILVKDELPPGAGGDLPASVTEQVLRTRQRVNSVATILELGKEVLVTGTPVRGDFFRLTRKQAKQKLGMDDGRPLIVSFFGSLGAAEVNKLVREALPKLLEDFQIVHI